MQCACEALGSPTDSLCSACTSAGWLIGGEPLGAKVVGVGSVGAEVNGAEENGGVPTVEMISPLLSCMLVVGGELLYE